MECGMNVECGMWHEVTASVNNGILQYSVQYSTVEVNGSSVCHGLLVEKGLSVDLRQKGVYLIAPLSDPQEGHHLCLLHLSTTALNAAMRLIRSKRGFRNVLHGKHPRNTSSTVQGPTLAWPFSSRELDHGLQHVINIVNSITTSGCNVLYAVHTIAGHPWIPCLQKKIWKK
jgi:hypothetical protein